jgi:flavin reductase (DIM6/NTAB) family NADH-FMN oxidoreductase RutF
MDKTPIDPLTTTGVLDVLPPFPIVLVTTRTNVLTIGQVEYFTLSPLRIGIAVAHSRHSYSLLRQESEFVVNVSIVEAVKTCGSLSGGDCDKFEAAGLTTEDSALVRAVSIRQCAAHIECRVDREVAFENRTWFIGKVVAARRRADHSSAAAVLCGRHDYVLPGEPIAPR